MMGRKFRARSYHACPAVIRVYCERCGWVDEAGVKFLNIEEDIQGRDVMTFVCPCGLEGKSFRRG